jgi:hypothetical protein
MNRYANAWALVAIVSSSAVLADGARQFRAVICTSEAGAPWSEKARGTLTRSSSKDTVSYELKVGEQAFTWRFVANPPQGTTVIGPGYLMDRFAAQPAKGEEAADRRQSLYADGEIREYAASGALRLIVGSKCPRASASQVEKNGLVGPLHPNVEVINHTAR